MKNSRNNSPPRRAATIGSRWGAGQSFRALLLAIGLSGALLGCVRTAECDGTVACDDGEVCYDYECRAVCDETTACDGECAACLQNDSDGQHDHCFGAAVLACIPQQDE